MRLLLVSDFFPPVRGGLEHHVDALAGALSGLGHEVHVATLTPEAVPQDPRVTVHTVRSAAARVLPHEDPQRPFHPPLPDPVTRLDLARVVRQVRPDVVHGHSWLAVSLPHGPVPLVLTAHDYALVCQLHTLVRSSGELCDGPGTHCLPCGAGVWGAARSALMAPGTVVGRRLLRPARVLAVSEAVAAALRPKLGAVSVVPNFLPDEPADPAPVALDLPTGPYVAFAGDPGVHKGVGLLLDLWASDPPPAELVLAVTKPLERDLPPGVRVCTLSRAGVTQLFAGAHAVLVPSLWPDPFPTTALEAMAAGTAVLASRTGGLVDMLRDGQDGLLLPPGDQVAWGTALREVLADPVHARAMGDSARARSASYRASGVVAQVEQHYREVLAESAPAGPTRA